MTAGEQSRRLGAVEQSLAAPLVRLLSLCLHYAPAENLPEVCAEVLRLTADLDCLARQAAMRLEREG